MKRNKIFRLCTGVLLVSIVAVVRAHGQTVVASDDADNSQYSPQPDHNWPITNGGSGYGLWTPLGDVSGGGTYMEGVGVNGRQVTGNDSFALYAGGGAYDISRPLTSSLTSGEFDVVTRFDIAASPGSGLVNLRAGNNTSAFGSGELLSFGLVNNNQLSYTDSSGFHVLPSGEARGSVWSWDVQFNATSGAFTLSVTNLGGGFADVISGNFETNGTSVGSFAVINSSTGNGQNVVFDNPTFITSAPEPASLAILGIGTAAFVAFRRRKIKRAANQG